MALYQRAFEGARGFNPDKGFELIRADQKKIVSQFEKDFSTELDRRKDLRKLLQDVFRPALDNPDDHLHLKEPIFVNFVILPATTSPPIFNVYDALAVVHTLLASRDKTNETWAPGTTEPPETIKEYIDSLHWCCAIFARGVDDSKKTRTKKKVEALPSVVGFAVPALGIGIPGTTSGSIGSADFGVSAAGDKSMKENIAARRLKEFVKNPTTVKFINEEQKKKGEHWHSGNCAEQLFWPRKGSLPGTKYYALAYSNGKKMDDWEEEKEACKNCKRLMINVMQLQGYDIVDRYKPSAE